MSDQNSGVTSPLLSEAEQEAIWLSGELAVAIRRIIGEGPNGYHDWAEASMHLHALQNMLLAQAAARAYPRTYRLLGHQLNGDEQGRTTAP